MCDKINDIPSIEVSDQSKFKKQWKNVTLILKKYLDMVIVIKQKEAWSIKNIDVKARPPIDNYAFKSLILHITQR